MDDYIKYDYDRWAQEEAYAQMVDELGEAEVKRHADSNARHHGFRDFEHFRALYVSGALSAEQIDPNLIGLEFYL
jgi:hypothetical protein